MTAFHNELHPLLEACQYCNIHCAACYASILAFFPLAHTQWHSRHSTSLGNTGPTYLADSPLGACHLFGHWTGGTVFRRFHSFTVHASRSISDSVSPSHLAVRFLRTRSIDSSRKPSHDGNGLPSLAALPAAENFPLLPCLMSPYLQGRCNGVGAHLPYNTSAKGAEGMRLYIAPLIGRPEGFANQNTRKRQERPKGMYISIQSANNMTFEFNCPQMLTTFTSEENFTIDLLTTAPVEESVL